MILYDNAKMNQITVWLIDNVFRNDVMLHDENIREAYTPEEPGKIDLVNIIASLHNLLYECVTGERYNYMFHWANKEGAWCDDHIFDDVEEEE